MDKFFWYGGLQKCQNGLQEVLENARMWYGGFINVKKWCSVAFLKWKILVSFAYWGKLW